MKRFLMSFLAIFFPWLVLLINDDPAGALIALVMQVTLIGWIPASLWAFRSIRPPLQDSPSKTTATKGTNINAKP